MHYDLPILKRVEDVEPDQPPISKKHSIPEMRDYASLKISKRAKVVSDKPMYKKKEKSESGGTIYRYDEKALKLRSKEKKEKLDRLEKDIKKVREQYKKDLSSDDPRTRAIAAVVSLIDETAIRVGNTKSADERKTYGATTLKVKHIKLSGNSAKLNFVGKSNVKQSLTVKDSKTISVLKELIKGKKGEDFIFSIDGKRIWDRAINRYLQPFKISAKDIRGFHANKLMRDKLKSKDFGKALEETAKEVGHESSTLKNQYLDPGLVEKYEKPIKKKAVNEEITRVVNEVKEKYFGKQLETIMTAHKGNDDRIMPGVKYNSLIYTAWTYLVPYLPSSAVMTSGTRDSDDQKRILENYWYKATGKILTDKQKKQDAIWVEISNRLKDYGYIVGPPTTTRQHGHLKGNSFDISGATLGEIANAVTRVSNDQDIPVRFGLLVEPKNDAVHVNVLSLEQPIAVAFAVEDGKIMAYGEDIICLGEDKELEKEINNGNMVLVQLYE